MVTLRFVSGTVEIRGLEQSVELLPTSCSWDRRSRCHRTPACEYAPVVLALRGANIEYQDDARAYTELPAGLRAHRKPRPFQQQAVDAWQQAGGRGVVVLPTGSGKSHVAIMAIDGHRRSTLVVAPTLDLVRQWYDLLRQSFDQPVGVVGGGDHQVHPLTVTTYDSAHLHMEHLGARFGMVVFDECHHLPNDTYGMAARLCLAPYRLGLTATLERVDGREQELDELIGPVAFRRDIVDLSGAYLAPYDTVRMEVELAADERERYHEARATYLAFLRRHGIQVASSAGWSKFILRASQGDEGRAALDAYRVQRQLAFAARAKLDCLDDLLQQHRRDRAIVFTEDNATVYEISRRFLIPAMTHQSRVTERSEILAGLSNGTYGAIVTSKVLNEGVDVPAANVAIVISGSGSVREHVQRLGRVLRKQRDKRATLYEVVARDTTEAQTSARRRDHSAYR